MPPPTNELAGDYIRVSLSDFHTMKRVAEKAMMQLKSDDYHWRVDGESNSIAVLIQHLSGNMISRWTDFLTSDGEKETRERDKEFIDEYIEYKKLNEIWNQGWVCLFKTLENLTEPDLSRSVYIRGKSHTVVEAISQSLWHYSTHVGQIIYIAKHLCSAEWVTLSIPRGKSADYFRIRQTGPKI